MGADILIILALILFGGFLAMAEMALGASRGSRLAKAAKDKVAGAACAVRLRDKPSKLLSATQLGITAAALLSGIFGEASLAERLEPALKEGLPFAGEWAKPIATAATVSAITFFALVLGEVVPRRIALARPEGVACFAAPAVELFLKLASPAIWLVSKASDALLAVLLAPAAADVSAHEEIRLLISEGRGEGGGLGAAEGEVLENVFRLDQRRVAAIMTPAADIVYLDIKWPKERAKAALLESSVSRLVVCREGLSDVLGWISADEALRTLASTGEFDLGALQIKPMPFVPSNMSLFGLLEMFRRKKTGVAVAVNEFGTVEGIVSSSDLLGTMIGAQGGLVSEDSTPMAIRRDDGSWLLDGLMPADEMLDVLGLGEIPEEIMGSFHTVGGFMVSIMGKIPRKAESAEFGGWKFEVVDMDKNRVDEVLAKKTETKAESPAA